MVQGVDQYLCVGPHNFCDLDGLFRYQLTFDPYGTAQRNQEAGKAEGFLITLIYPANIIKSTPHALNISIILSSSL